MAETLILLGFSEQRYYISAHYVKSSSSAKLGRIFNDFNGIQGRTVRLEGADFFNDFNGYISGLSSL